jgi:hypothetical protein
MVFSMNLNLGSHGLKKNLINELMLNFVKNNSFFFYKKVIIKGLQFKIKGKCIFFCP